MNEIHYGDSLDALVDGELPAADMERIRAHLETCSACAAEHQQIMETSRILARTGMRYQAPDVLKARIRAAIGNSTIDAKSPAPSRSRSWVWASSIAAAVVIAVASSGITLVASRDAAHRAAVADEVLTSHIRSLIPGHLTDVASNDQHNVKPWFNGRVDASPAVPRLDSVDYPLLGGRVDYVGGHTVPVVVYARRQHMINVFTWPASGANRSTPSVSTRQGYHLLQSRQDGLEVWIVSDLNIAELEDFARRYRQP